MGSDSGLLVPWLKMAREQRSFLQTKSQMLQQSFGSGQAKLDLSLIWDGEGRNRNAALTIFRHFDSASVVQGLVGAPPKTAWVIDYPLFERIFYLLVAGYDVYGNVGHQLNSRLYMDFMRMEGEFNFLMFLPQARAREHGDVLVPRRHRRGARIRLRQERLPQRRKRRAPTAAATRSASCTNCCASAWRRCSTRASTWPACPTRGCAPSCSRWPAVKGASLSWLPEMSVLRIDGRSGGPRYFTLLRNTAHANVAHLAREKSELLPDENTLTVVPGFIGAYPNAIYRVSADDLPALRAAIARHGVGRRLPQAGRPLCGTAHQPAVLGGQRCAARCLWRLGAAGSRAVRLQPITEPLSRRERPVADSPNFCSRRIAASSYACAGRGRWGSESVHVPRPV